MSYGLTARILQDILPLNATQNAATVHNHLHKIAQRQEDELIGKPEFISGCPRDWGNLPKPDTGNISFEEVVKKWKKLLEERCGEDYEHQQRIFEMLLNDDRLSSEAKSRIRSLIK